MPDGRCNEKSRRNSAGFFWFERGGATYRP
jgi:hypothetical protein